MRLDLIDSAISTACTTHVHFQPEIIFHFSLPLGTNEVKTAVEPIKVGCFKTRTKLIRTE